jgi:hypothetical protein
MKCRAKGNEYFIRFYRPAEKAGDAIHCRRATWPKFKLHSLPCVGNLMLTSIYSLYTSVSDEAAAYLGGRTLPPIRASTSVSAVDRKRFSGR